MTGFEPQTSGIGSDRSTNWATTTARISLLTQSFWLSEFAKEFIKLIETFPGWNVPSICWKKVINKWKEFLTEIHWRSPHPVKIWTPVRRSMGQMLQNLFDVEREPWSSGYGRRLMFQSLWVRILAPYTGWAWHFSHLFVVIIVSMCVWKRENKWKRGRGWPN